MDKTRTFQIIFFILIFSISLSAQEITHKNHTSQPSLQYHITSNYEELPLPSLNWILEEGEQSLEIENIIKGNVKDATYIHLEEESRFKIRAHKSYWLHLRLSSDVEMDSTGLVMKRNGNGWPWEFTFKYVEAHIYNKGKKIKTGFSGTEVSYWERDYPEKIDPSLILLNLEKEDTLDIWMKLVMAEAMNAEIKLELSSQTTFKSSRPANFYFSSHHMLNGAGIVLLLISFALFAWFRNPVYLWFMIFQSLIFLNTYGMDFKNEAYLFFCKSNPRILVIGSTLITLSMLLSLFQFGRVYIGTKAKFPKIHNILSILMIALIIMTLPGIIFRIFPLELGTQWFAIRQILMAIIFFSILLALLSLAFTKDKLARVFSLGILGYFALTLIRLININISDNPGDSYVTLFNHLFSILTSTVILAYRFVLITQEKEKANEEKIRSNIEKLKQQQLAEQKTKEAERLEELERVKSNFFSNVTHEFRTPLTLIIEPLRQIIEQPEKPWLNKVKLAQNNSQKLLHLINQLLDVSKLENQQMQLELQHANIIHIIQPLLDSFAYLAKEKGIGFSVNYHETVPSFDLDIDKMEKIISNLISNAIKFTKKGGSVQIDIREQETNGAAYFTFNIKDTGVGISEKNQALIFDRFYQVDGSNTREQQGTGIGLSLSKELVELMDGTITLQSEQGKGSTFEVKIPMRFELEQQISTTKKIQAKVNPLDVVHPEESTVNNDIDLKANNIALVVEDNDELRQFIIASIEENYQVIEASNGQEGLEKAIAFIPNIIISDVMMPKMNGFDLCEKIKTNEKTAHIPIILLTAKTAMDSRIQGLEFGADAYMNKPFNTKELLIRMKNLIEVRKLLQQKFSQDIEDNTRGSLISDNTISDFDKRFLERVNKFITQQMGKEELSVEDIAKEMAMSRTQLFRKLKALLNQSPSELLRSIRLKTARQLLLEKKGNISEVAYQVGFSSPKYFSTKFKKKYGVSPSEL